MSETILSEEQDVEQSQQAVPLFTRPSLRIVSRPVSKSTTTAEFNLNKSFNTSSESKKRQFKVPSRSASTASSSTSSTMIVSPLAVRQSSAAPLDFSFQDFESLSGMLCVIHVLKIGRLTKSLLKTLFRIKTDRVHQNPRPHQQQLSLFLVFAPQNQQSFDLETTNSPTCPISFQHSPDSLHFHKPSSG